MEDNKKRGEVKMKDSPFFGDAVKATFLRSEMAASEILRWARILDERLETAKRDVAEMVDMTAGEACGKFDWLPFRCCSECGDVITEGYVDGDDVLCGDCRSRKYTDEEWDGKYEDCDDECYYTEWS
jgi:hypothetical protein